MNTDFDTFVAEESAKREGEELLQFLLNAMPLYARATYGHPHESAYLLADLRSQMGRGPCHNLQHSLSVPARSKVTSRGCPDCKFSVVCVDEETAAFVCTLCGLQGPSGLEHGHRDPSAPPILPRYTYQPNKYLGKLMDEMEAVHTPRVSADVLRALQNDLHSRGISTTDISPVHVHEALKRLKLPKLYGQRWRLTQILNSEYTSLHIPTDVRMRVIGLFRGCFQRFVVRNRGCKRKFYSYHLFLKCVLSFVGLPNVAVHFTPMKNQKNQARQEKEITSLLRTLLGHG